MASRKTIEVAAIKGTLNARIVAAKTEDEKKGLCTALEEILHATGNYHGWGYNLTSEQWNTLWNNGNILGVSHAIELGWLTEYDRHYL